VGVGAEAAVDARETWQTAQARLYAELGQQLKALWANGNGKPAQGASESHLEVAAELDPTEKVHYCQEHRTAFEQHSRGENVWWSHKTSGWEVVPGEVGCTCLPTHRGPWGSLRGPFLSPTFRTNAIYNKV